jgi:DNA-binding MarR family transcriptional regulator
MWHNKSMNGGNSRYALLPTPTLVLILANSRSRQVRADFAGAGMGGLRPLHGLLLFPLLRGARRASDLAASIGVSRQAIAQVVATLERDGYLNRVADPGDARAKLICLTPRGRAAVRTMRASAQAAEDSWLASLGEARLADLRDSLLTLLSPPPSPVGEQALLANLELRGES